MVKIGCIGDSDTDAFRGTDNRGGSYSAITFNWLELLVNLRSLDCGTWGSYAEPRRTDYARNYARSAAHSGTCLSEGQHTGLASALDASTYALCLIGNNDIRPDNPGYQRIDFGTIYNDGTHPPTYYANPIVTDVWTAVDALVAANPAGVLMADYADQTMDPAVAVLWPNATNLARVTAVFAEINAQLHAGAVAHGVKILDWHWQWTQVLSQMAVEGGSTYTLWGTTLTKTLGDEPHNLQLADNHIGTCLNWVISGWVIDALNTSFGLSIRRISPYEVFDVVGFTGRPTGQIGRG